MRGGFALLGVLITLAAILMVAIFAVPSTAGDADQQRVKDTARQLARVRSALYQNDFNDSITTRDFYSNVGGNAGRLSELVTPIVAGDSSATNSCNGPFDQVEADNWATSGPFINYFSDRTMGMTTPIGQTTDTLTRIPGSLRVNFPSVDLNDAILLDRRIDGGDGFAAGAVQWIPQNGNADGTVTLYYLVPTVSDC